MPERLIVVSSDCHAGLPIADYKPYVESRYHPMLDVAVPVQLEMMEKASKSFLIDEINEAAGKKQRIKVLAGVKKVVALQAEVGKMRKMSVRSLSVRARTTHLEKLALREKKLAEELVGLGLSVKLVEHLSLQLKKLKEEMSEAENEVLDIESQAHLSFEQLTAFQKRIKALPSLDRVRDQRPHALVVRRPRGPHRSGERGYA